jgi:DNA invertase Pin-like site-specific DNA recombinase
MFSRAVYLTQCGLRFKKFCFALLGATDGFKARHFQSNYGHFTDCDKEWPSSLDTSATQIFLKRICHGNVNFSVILVYDVSRWGRFQDADESAYYEYICRKAGVAVHYCAEQFENDGSPVSTIVKGVKRAMAGEYSRELSSKVSASPIH